MAAVLIAMAFTPSLTEELKVSLLSLAVAVIAYCILRARRQSLTAARAPTD
jgi:hypothetical protein